MRAFSSASTAQLTCPLRHPRHKTRPTHPHQHHPRYKTRPAHRKTPNLGTFSRAGRINSRLRIKQAEQGEFIHACGSNKPSRGLSLAHAASFEAQHTAANLHAPTWRRPSSAGEARHTAADLHAPPIRRLLMNPVATDRTGMKENTPMRGLFRGTVKHYSPRHAQRDHYSTVLSARGRFLFQRSFMPRTRAPCWGGISFTRTRLGQ